MTLFSTFREIIREKNCLLESEKYNGKLRRLTEHEGDTIKDDFKSKNFDAKIRFYKTGSLKWSMAIFPKNQKITMVEPIRAWLNSHRISS